MHHEAQCIQSGIGNLMFKNVPQPEHFAEALKCLSELEIARLIKDISMFQSSGNLSGPLEDTVRRASCMASADIIGAKYA
jgi:hypothetical protein